MHVKIERLCMLSLNSLLQIKVMSKHVQNDDVNVGQHDMLTHLDINLISTIIYLVLVAD